jgi:uncharacterized protein (DUF924 family)
MKENSAFQEVLLFWFGDDSSDQLKNKALWFKKDNDFDTLIRERFEPLLNDAVTGDLQAWREDARSCLAFVVLLDQFSRNMYRDTPKAFSQDALALEASKDAVAKRLDKALSTIERSMFYMPFMHSEKLDDQRRGIELFEQLKEDAEEDLKPSIQMNIDYMKRHAEIIETFGRFPHRNAILNRESTAEEKTFLKTPNSSF